LKPLAARVSLTFKNLIHVLSPKRGDTF